jgi:hypothetical protein
LNFFFFFFLFFCIIGCKCWSIVVSELIETSKLSLCMSFTFLMCDLCITCHKFPPLSSSLKSFLITLIFSSFSPFFSCSSKTFQLPWFMCHVHPFSLACQKLHEWHDLCVHSPFLLSSPNAS